MKKPTYNDDSAREVFIDMAVRVQPENEPSYEAKMKTSLLKPGVRVQYDPAKREQIRMDYEPAEILERNPQLRK